MIEKCFLCNSQLDTDTGKIIVLYPYIKENSVEILILCRPCFLDIDKESSILRKRLRKKR